MNCPECHGRKTIHGRYCQECDGLGWTDRASIDRWYADAIARDAADAEYDRMRAEQGW